MSAEVDERDGRGALASVVDAPHPGENPAAIELDQVTKEYPGGVVALRDVSVEIPAGDQVAVVGPSGSGKTTMLTILGTLERPTSGEVQVAGRDTATAPTASSRACAHTRSASSSRASTCRRR